MMVLEVANDLHPEENFSISRNLRPLLNLMIDYSEDDNEEKVPVSLEAFRARYVWREAINDIFEINLEGIMDVFSKFADPIGFTINSGEKLLKGIGCLLPKRMVGRQFDLAQMTVIDELANSDEYDDMVFVEFLEFLVRIAFHNNLGES